MCIIVITRRLPKCAWGGNFHGNTTISEVSGGNSFRWDEEAVIASYKSQTYSTKFSTGRYSSVLLLVRPSTDLQL